MALTSLASIRAKLEAQDNRKSGNFSGGDNIIYPHWNIPENTDARIRFLPDANTKNDFFWVERLMINLEFPGIKNQPDSKRVTVQVPCMEMYGEACPILAEVRPWYKDESLKETANKYWKKKSYLLQGFVRQNPLSDDQPPANPIRRFVISSQIFNLIKSALLDPELENLPTDYQNGLDFTISKTTKGQYADYSTSKWARKETGLTPDEMAAIEQYGLFDLGEGLPKKPTETELKVITEMFEASVDGKPYDLERWGAYFRPRGVQAPSSQPAQETVVAEKAVAQQEVVEDTAESIAEPTAPIETPAVSTPARNPADILAAIRARQTNQ
jgi:hypothetical protein